MADIRKLAEEIVNLTSEEVATLMEILKTQYGVELAAIRNSKLFEDLALEKHAVELLETSFDIKQNKLPPKPYVPKTIGRVSKKIGYASRQGSRRKH